MTLASVPRYDDAEVERVGEHAVVAGAGMAGLLAARVLDDAFDRVTLLERDSPGDAATPRQGTPQARHVHIMLEAGRRTIEDLCPGYTTAVREEGGVDVDAGTDVRYFQDGAFMAPGREPHPMLCATRPLFEACLRERVLDRPGVAMRAPAPVAAFRTDSTGAVDGVAIRTEDGDTEDVAADLVVDATGRASRTPRVLERTGHREPPTDTVTVDLAYSTRVLERPPDARAGYLVGPTPERPRGGTVLPVEGDRWMVTLFGLGGDHPPTDSAGFARFAASLPTDVVADVIDRQDPVDDEIHHYPFPASRWRHYERLAALPGGILPIGDAVASFNPIYGQGMSVAALEALQLHHALGGGADDALAERYLEGVARVVATVWRITVGSDFALPATSGPKPRGTALLTRYLNRVVRAAHRDGRVTDAFADVFLLEEEPTRLLHPSIVLRVLAPTGRFT